MQPQPQAPDAASEALYAVNLLADFKHWAVYLHPNQYFLGRVYIWCKRPDAIDFVTDLTPEEQTEFFMVAKLAQRCVSTLFKPRLFNQGSLGNETRRCHIHIVPRYDSPCEFAGVLFTDDVYGKNWGRYGKEEDPLKDRVDIFDQLRRQMQLVFRQLIGS